MAYNETLAHRLREMLKLFPETFTEKKMFGGLSFLYKGKMTVGIIKDDLAVRVVEDKMPELLELPHVRPMDFTKKPMKEFVYVAPEGFAAEAQLHRFVMLGLEHARSKI